MHSLGFENAGLPLCQLGILHTNISDPHQQLKTIEQEIHAKIHAKLTISKFRDPDSKM